MSKKKSNHQSKTYKDSDVENLVDEARLALVALINVAGWSDENDVPASFVKHCLGRLKKALEPFE